jgi:prolyl-tRNA synthetase
MVVIVDEREMRGGEKAWSWIKKGVPVRIGIGPRDIAAGVVSMARRDRGHKDYLQISREECIATAADILDDIQNELYRRALAFRDQNIKRIDDKDEFYAFFTPKNADRPEIHGGFALSHWSGDPAVEEQIKRDLNVTIRCIPMEFPEEEGRCVISGKPSTRRVIFAKSY